MSEVHPGAVIAGKFQVERVLGEGGMGYVVAARHLQLGQMVALKFMREDVMTDEYRSRFLREARNTVRLKSKHVSRVLDVGSLDGGVPYMVMEYLEGTDLSDLLQKRGPFPPAEACDYIIQACEAIAEAHGHGIIHRDLKPANLFLTHGSGGEPVIKVLDFGVSKSLDLLDDTNDSSDRHRSGDSVVTKATDLLGSPSYMSPEQVMSSRDADAGSDVWSLGVILFRLISGKAPFTGKSLGDLIQNIVHSPLPNLREVCPNLPPGLEHAVWQALERDRKRRPDVIALARLLAPYAGPNAAPSLERIAILGPALVTSTLQVPAMTAQSAQLDAATAATIVAPSSRTNPSRARRSGGAFWWGLLLVAVLSSALVVGAKLFRPTAGPAPPSPTTVVSSAAAPGIAVTTAETPPPAPPPPSPPPTAVTPPAIEPPPVLTAAASVPSPSPSSVGSRSGATRPAQHPAAGGPHRPRPTPSTPAKPAPPTPAPTPPPAPTSDIPPTRD